jgi:1,4-dihydroxy-2-naphthoate octaprenyltransferase
VTADEATEARDFRTVVRALFAMSRPSQLLLIAVVYALGVAIGVARGPALDTTGAIAGLAVLLPVAASVHYANEYADYETDALTDRTPFSGGSGALQKTGLDRGLALRAAQVTLTAGTAGAVWCLLHGLTTPTLAVLAGIAVFGWQYSVEPLALSRHGLGEVTNAALGGLLLPLYGFAVQTGSVRASVLLACLPFALLVFVNLLETQWPDREADAAVGKRTLPTRWHARRLRVAYALGALAAFLALAALSGRVLPPLVAWASVPAVPPVAWGVVRYTRREKPFPAVVGMVVVAVGQLAAWSVVAGLI